MLRKLLACLALLTGLVATGAPAQAEVAAALSSRVVATARAEACSSQAAIVIAQALPVRSSAIVAPDHLVSPDRAQAPSVYYGIDRARE